MKTETAENISYQMYWLFCALWMINNHYVLSPCLSNLLCLNKWLCPDNCVLTNDCVRTSYCVLTNDGVLTSYCVLTNDCVLTSYCVLTNDCVLTSYCVLTNDFFLLAWISFSSQNIFQYIAPLNKSAIQSWVRSKNCSSLEVLGLINFLPSFVP